ncbi:MAG: hypothetical protein JST44_23450 [Cyanobacteria bacterium SZAS LIN-5]|nr:hypothetical protein [Cyanobacteria bacterium SZAS LIN-5]
MIECPICHVMNEEQAHFCSECGQRFAPASPQSSFQNPNAAAAPEPVFPSFPPADKAPSPQPQAVQDYQQASNFGTSANQFDNSAFGGPPSTGAPPQSPGIAPQQASFNPPQTPAFNPPNTPAFNPPNTPAFNPPNTSAFNNVAQPAGQSFDTETPSSNASQETQSKTFPPEPEVSQSPPLPARPKLHSPIFDGPDEPSTRPQAPKPAGGFGGMSKPKGLRSPLLGEDDSEVDPPAPKPRSGGLRSPLLRGEDDPDLPQRGKGSLRGLPADDPPAPSPGKSKGGLRSPLLGAAEDDFVPQSKPVKPPKGLPPRTGSAHLRSPLLGGVDDYEGDEEDDDLPPVPGKTPFPHVRRPASARDKDPADKAPESTDQTSSGKFPGRSHLRSPLLGGADLDDEPAPAPSPSRPAGGRPRLHSPIMDGAGGQSFESDYDEPYYEEIDDPNVLRSPLLAARSKHIAPEPAAPPAPSKITPGPAPAAPPPAASFPDTKSFADTPAPAQPEFRDRGFPDPQPPGDMWRDRGFAESRAAEPKVVPPAPTAPSTPPEVASKIKDSSPAPALRRSSRSGLLGGGADDIDEQPINNYRNSPAAQPKPAMVLIIPCVIAVLAKLWYMSIMGPTLMQSMPFLADQLMQLVVIIALIIFAVTAGKR